MEGGTGLIYLPPWGLGEATAVATNGPLLACSSARFASALLPELQSIASALSKPLQRATSFVGHGVEIKPRGFVEAVRTVYLCAMHQPCYCLSATDDVPVATRTVDGLQFVGVLTNG